MNKQSNTNYNADGKTFDKMLAILDVWLLVRLTANNSL
jgi:hypothetical protein